MCVCVCVCVRACVRGCVRACVRACVRVQCTQFVWRADSPHQCKILATLLPPLRQLERSDVSFLSVEIREQAFLSSYSLRNSHLDVIVAVYDYLQRSIYIQVLQS